MRYRQLGKTDMSASVIGLGCEHLDRKPYSVVEETLHAALENDINILDVFMPGTEVRENIGKAIKGNRKEFIIQGHIGSTNINQQYDISRDLSICKKYFENLLKSLDTNYIDVGMCFFIDSDNDFDGVFNSPIIDYVLQLKKDGVIRAIGASSHNPKTAKRVIETGVVELLMFSINPAFDLVPANVNVLDVLDEDFSKETSMVTMDAERSELYQLCQSNNIPITVMKTFGAGKLLSPKHTPFSKPLSVGQCIHYALDRPSVASVMLGCQNKNEVLDAVKYLEMSEKELDYSVAIQDLASDFSGKCVYCSHCLPCPSNIDIATVNKYLDIAKLDENNIPPSIVQHYNALEALGSECIECGSCEERCPFSVNIIDNMQHAAKLLER